MRLKSGVLGALAGLFALVAFGATAVAANRPNKDGPATIVSSIRAVPGAYEDCVAWLAGPYKQAMEAQKAALDNMNAKLHPIYETLQGSMAEQNRACAERSKMRTVLSDEMIREMVLK